jgi:hypothetical protein
MALVGNRYIAASDPGAVGFGYEWADTTTGNIYERDTGNSAWVLAGNSDVRYRGCVPITGGALAGALTGAHGLASLTSPNFQTAAKVDGVNVATVNDLATAVATMNKQIELLVASAVAASQVGSSAKPLVAAASGFVQHTYDEWVALSPSRQFTIPLPTYTVNGVSEQALEADCKWAASLCTAGGSPVVEIDPITAGSRTYEIDWSGSTPSGTDGYAVSYVIVAVR